MIAATNWTVVGSVGAVIVAAFSALFGLIMAIRTDKSARLGKMTEITVVGLVDQLQEERDHLNRELEAFRRERDDLRSQLAAARAEISQLRTDKDEMQRELTELRHRVEES